MAQAGEATFQLVLVAEDGRRSDAGDFASEHLAVKAFERLAGPNVRGRVVDTSENREVWLGPLPIKRKKALSKPTPAQVLITAWGETKGLLAWERDPRCKAPFQTIKARLLRYKLRQWTPEEAISTPPDHTCHLVKVSKDRAHLVEIFGETKTIQEWINDPRCEADRLWFRTLINRGVPPELALKGIAPAGFRKRESVVVAWGESKLVTDWSRDPRCRVSFGTLKRLLREGHKPEEVILGLACKRRPFKGQRKARNLGDGSSYQT